MTRPTSPVAIRRRTSVVLKALREQTGLTQEEAASRANITKSSLSRYEGGISAPKFHTMQALMNLYNASEEVAKEMEKLALQATKRGWKTFMFGEGANVPEYLSTYVGLEATATSLLIYDFIIPGLFQTEAYAREVIAASGRTGGELERGVRLRDARQTHLTNGNHKPTVHAVLDESIIHRKVGGPDVMREQMGRLVSLGKMENITIQIVPFVRGAPCAAVGAGYVILGLDPDPPIVYLESYEFGHYIEDTNEVRRSTIAFHDLAGQALSPAQSARLLAKASKEDDGG